MSREIADVLRRALAAFGPNGENWVNHAPRSSEEYCSVTAIRKVETDLYLRMKINDELCARVGNRVLSDWNDSHTFPEVKAAFEEEIKAQEAQ